MHISIYHAIHTWQDLPAEELFEKMESLKPGLFTDLLDVTENPENAKKILLYISHAYSKESDLVVLGQRDDVQKPKIASFVGLPDFLHGDVVLLQHPKIREIVLAYLEAQQDRKWRHLQRDKDLYEKMSDSLVQTITREDGKVDFKLMLEASRSRAELLKGIEEMEDEYRQEYKFVTENQEDIKKIQKASQHNHSLGVEHSQYIK